MINTKHTVILTAEDTRSIVARFDACLVEPDGAQEALSDELSRVAGTSAASQREGMILVGLEKGVAPLGVYEVVEAFLRSGHNVVIDGNWLPAGAPVEHILDAIY